MNVHLLQTRVEAAHLYVLALDDSFAYPWLQQYEDYLSGNLSLPQAMALIHPEHYAAWTHTEHIRGSRAFSAGIGTQGLHCRAVHLWGYDCAKTNLVADHLFPYALGGPTTSENKLLLCQWHNTVKSSDIHFYSWEAGEPKWLKQVLAKINIVQRRSLPSS